MRFERLVIQAGENTFALDFHPCLTVVAGAGAAERASLTAELIGAVNAGRSGVHLEVVEDDGRRLAVFRPHGGAHRVVDVDHATDVSAAFRDDGGAVDLSVDAGIEPETLRRTMLVTSDDLAVGSHGDDRVRALAAIDPGRLWDAAERAHRATLELRSVAEAVGTAPEDAALVEKIERRQNELDTAARRHRRMTRRAAFAAAAAGILGVPLLYLFGPAAAIPAAVVALVMVTIALLTRRRLRAAHAAAREALSLAGAQSYLGFQLQRIEGMLANPDARRRLGRAGAAHRLALDAWRSLAGDVSPEWVLDHAEEIEAAALVRSSIHAVDAVASDPIVLDEAGTAELAQALTSRLASVRDLGARRESFPLVLDEPFDGISASVKPALLELLGRAAGSPQLVLLTNDEDIVSWARLEAMTGDVAVVDAGATAPV